MKKIEKTLLLFTLCLISISASAQGNDDNPLQWKPNSFRELGSNATVGTAMESFTDWPRDDNGEVAALLRIQIEDMAMDDAKRLTPRVLPGLVQLIKWEFHDEIGTPEIWIYVSPGSFSLEVYGDGYKSRPYTIESEKKLKSKKIYTLDLVCRKKINITIRTIPREVSVFVDNKKSSDEQIKVSSGKHTVSFSQNGKSLNRDTVIDVSEQNNNFLFDLRKRYTVHVTSEPSKADVFVFVRGEKREFGKTPTDVTLPEGSYTMIIRKNDQLVDTSQLLVDKDKEVEIHLEQKKTVVFSARYQGRVTSSYLSIRRIDGGVYIPPKGEADGKTKKVSFSIELPYGSYEVTMRDDHNMATQKVTVNGHSPLSYEFDIKPPKQQIVWPWERDYDNRVAGFYIGYVQHQFELTDGSGVSEFCDPAWSIDGKSMYGVRMGLHFQPSFSWGLGVYTGVFFEYCYSSSPESSRSYGDSASMAEMFESYSEKAFSVPLHLYYRIPFSNNFALFAHGGLDIDYYFGGVYKDHSSDFDAKYTPPYGDGWTKKHFNFGYSVAAGIRWGGIALEASWNFGITNHEMKDWAHVPTVKYPHFSAGLSFVF